MQLDYFVPAGHWALVLNMEDPRRFNPGTSEESADRAEFALRIRTGLRFSSVGPGLANRLEATLPVKLDTMKPRQMDRMAEPLVLRRYF